VACSGIPEPSRSLTLFDMFTARDASYFYVALLEKGMRPTIGRLTYSLMRQRAVPPPHPYRLAVWAAKDARSSDAKPKEKTTRKPMRCRSNTHGPPRTALRRACPKNLLSGSSQMLDSASVKNSQRCRPETDGCSAPKPDLKSRKTLPGGTLGYINPFAGQRGRSRAKGA